MSGATPKSVTMPYARYARLCRIEKAAQVIKDGGDRFGYYSDADVKKLIVVLEQSDVA